MKVKIVCVGNIKDKFFVDAANEYYKRLNKFVNLSVVEVKEEKLPKNYSQADINNVVAQEGVRINAQLEGYVVLCGVNGKQFTSEDFSKELKKLENSFSTITFVIGGSYGTSPEIYKKANLVLGFGSFTFPHQLFRVMLAEQIYRAYTIINNITYHKWKLWIN